MTFQSFENDQIGINRVENLELYQYFNVHLKFTLTVALIFGFINSKGSKTAFKGTR